MKGFDVQEKKLAKELHNPPMRTSGLAEHTRTPLYTLSSGDLGTDASSVEKSLKKALEICAHWKAVMLIDEADVFLEARKTDSLQRNEIVSGTLHNAKLGLNFANISVGRAHELSDDDLDKLSQEKLNGRQIKNTMKTAPMLANSEGEKLQMKHLEIVLGVRKQAADYLEHAR
ncbi:P-loop containing nucleoside triphosphate hydrolase protein [Camillea tinctor]|nr:P-loop containing nucleoside triphosphate hydrolase protein [Camillea tinctor]